LALAQPAPADGLSPGLDPTIALAWARSALIAAAGGPPSTDGERPPALAAPGAVFLTVVLDGKTRACAGTLSPATGSLAEEIAAAAARAAAGDRRHPSLRPEEIARARLVLAFPGAMQPLAMGQAVDPRSFGLVVDTPGGAGVLLPGEARTFAWMLAEARRRAGATAADPGRARVFRAAVIGETELPPLESP
jgi:AMMECR1 domain-containing protein